MFLNKRVRRKNDRRAVSLDRAGPLQPVKRASDDQLRADRACAQLGGRQVKVVLPLHHVVRKLVADRKSDSPRRTVRPDEVDDRSTDLPLRVSRSGDRLRSVSGGQGIGMALELSLGRLAESERCHGVDGDAAATPFPSGRPRDASDGCLGGDVGAEAGQPLNLRALAEIDDPPAVRRCSQRRVAGSHEVQRCGGSGA